MRLLDFGQHPLGDARALGHLTTHLLERLIAEVALEDPELEQRAVAVRRPAPADVHTEPAARPAARGGGSNRISALAHALARALGRAVLADLGGLAVHEDAVALAIPECHDVKTRPGPARAPSLPPLAPPSDAGVAPEAAGDEVVRPEEVLLGAVLLEQELGAGTDLLLQSLDGRARHAVDRDHAPHPRGGVAGVECNVREFVSVTLQPEGHAPSAEGGGCGADHETLPKLLHNYQESGRRISCSRDDGELRWQRLAQEEHTIVWAEGHRPAQLQSGRAAGDPAMPPTTARVVPDIAVEAACSVGVVREKRRTVASPRILTAYACEHLGHLPPTPRLLLVEHTGQKRRQHVRGSRGALVQARSPKNQSPGACSPGAQCPRQARQDRGEQDAAR
mmetsp:Transcript_10138/g.31580  ORF Transcript_10138/g.31580 Transcript_10138/m.31580 type:complete len:393 (-) Transcript_10138:1274-2452(-)